MIVQTSFRILFNAFIPPTLLGHAMIRLNCAKLLLSAVCYFAANICLGQDPSSVEFFESRIRPILIQNCYECHSSTATREADLALDYRDGLLQGGNSGSAINPGKPDESLLFQAIQHRAGDLKMPPSGLQLSPEVLDDFRRWILAGAIDPRDDPPSTDGDPISSDWLKILEARKSWWSFQPIREVALPEPNSNLHPVDQFVNHRLASHGLQPNERASNEALVRRIYWNLLGLPPSREEQLRWTQELNSASSASDSPSGKSQWNKTWEHLIDTLLNDPRFGERWARHWMDWIRYAESHGSEGDPAIVNAWLYRDYLIRALNQSLPLDQLIREHIAGDLMPPRMDAESKLNQSLIATTHWRMVFHGFSPVDAMEERVRFTDDQINTFSKAFLGITLSCARCHDHKFDPISQADYYAMFGVLSSCRPGRRTADADWVLQQHHDQLRQLQAEFWLALASRWQQSLDQLLERLGTALNKVVDKPAKRLSPAENALKAAWENRNQLASSSVPQSDNSQILHWDMSQPSDLAKWYSVGTGLSHRPSPGDAVVAISGQQAISAVHSRGVNTRIISDKEAARICSPDFSCPPNSVLWVLCEGDGGAALRYAVEDYPRSGTIYPVYPLEPGLKWIQSDLSYWEGDSIFVEVSNSPDAPLLTGSQSRSWFRIDQVWVLPKGQRPPERESLYRRLCSPDAAQADVTRETWVRQFSQAAKAAIEDWSRQSLSADHAELLDLLASNMVLPNDLDDDRCRRLVEEYRKVESDLVVATRVPCLEETAGQDFPLLTRGDHRQPAEVVPRRFLEVIDGRPYESAGSGRLELAERVLAEDNPLTRRVLVNRVWQNLFGVGIVSTPDNLGRLGAEPTHPELLDWLAVRLPQLDWSLKSLVREIVTSETWLRSSVASPEALSKDPENRLLGRATVRRYEAESIRDALLLVTDNLDSSMYGPPQPNEGLRRSIYLPVIRNSLVPLLRTFDYPEPFTTVGRRDQTNVPAQSLALMNDPMVALLASRWAESLIAKHRDPQERARVMLESVLARTVTSDEILWCLQFIQTTQDKLDELVVRSRQLSEQLITTKRELNALEASAREQIGKQSTKASGKFESEISQAPFASHAEQSDRPSSEVEIPEPVLSWNFVGKDKSGYSGSLEFFGSAEITEDALVLSDGGYALSPVQSGNLREKTLTAWVQLDNLDQRGGGVVSVQSIDGNVFDSIVFGEQTPKQWLAGSNFFARTQSFRGESEDSAPEVPVQLVIVYRSDGMILAYRNGKAYGQPYQSSGLHEFTDGNWIVSLGLRHLPAARDKTFTGKIWNASVYDQALTPDQVEVLAGSLQLPITQHQLLAVMQDDVKEQWQSLNSLRQQHLAEQREIAWQLLIKADPNQQSRDKVVPEVTNLDCLSWTNFARALFTMKEFIYVP
jgi:hypothetical protein